jgi:hypothetical protein
MKGTMKKPDPKPAPVVRPGTREYRDAQRAQFAKKFDAAKKGRK